MLTCILQTLFTFQREIWDVFTFRKLGQISRDLLTIMKVKQYQWAPVTICFTAKCKRICETEWTRVRFMSVWGLMFVLFVCQPSVLCDSIAYSDSNETSNNLCTLFRLTCHHRYSVSQRVNRSGVLQIIRRFSPDLLSSHESCFYVLLEIIMLGTDYLRHVTVCCIALIIAIQMSLIIL